MRLPLMLVTLTAAGIVAAACGGSQPPENPTPVAVDTAAENARMENGADHDAGTGMQAEVADGVAKHREQPAAGLMARGL